MPFGYIKSGLMKKSAILFSFLVVIVISGCNSESGGLGQPQGQDLLVHNPLGLPPGSNAGSPSSPPTATVGTSCQGHDGQHFCVGLKYVVYKDTSGQPVASQTDAINNMGTVNSEWSQCQIGFQMEEFVAVDPTVSGLAFNTANSTDLDPIRQAYSDQTHFLVVTTGAWNRSGTLGSTAANAWTNLPGDGIYGAILEQPVATFPLIVAHELGHYMNLDHVSDTSDLMNPIIYDTSTKLTPDQCAIARSALSGFWNSMLR